MSNKFIYDKNIVEENKKRIIEKINYYVACQKRLDNVIAENENKLQGEAMDKMRSELAELDELMKEQMASVLTLIEKLESYCDCMSEADEKLESDLSGILGGE